MKFPELYLSRQTDRHTPQKSQHIIKWLTILTVIFMISGCRYPENVSARWADDVNLQYSKYNVPVKFYIENISLEKPEAYTPAICYLNPAETAKWREELNKNWPEFFSATPENALKLQIKITPSGQREALSPALQCFTGLLSFICTLGIFPAVENYAEFQVLRLSVENISRESQLKMYFRSWTNLGLAGMLVQTCHSMPELPDASVAGKGGGTAGPLLLNVRQGQFRKVLLPLVAELHSFPQEKIQELYLSRKTEKTTLLE